MAEVTLAEKIRADLTVAMKARDAERVSTLRMVQAALKNEQIEKGHELADEEVQAVLRRAVKQRQDSIEQFTKGGRQDLADKEAAELKLLDIYLPKQMGDEEIEAVVRDVITAVGATSKKDSGKVMKEVMARYKGVIDGKKVQEVVGRLLPE
jgi:uncharacterized protein YqeY